ncbi:Rv3235 family protein [Actinomadura rifamycini]|uniref:Rv3235 family protein n=1 Tax=Actinomadura rifamycini TaxID=31962 RepID=UPI00040DD308|nr:Rv3235 family protein [Actinomadura rifamycini]
MSHRPNPSRRTAADRRPDAPAIVRISRYRDSPGTDGALALARVPGVQAAESPLRIVRPGDDTESELRRIADTAVLMVAETLAGIRPPARLTLIAVPEVCRALDARRATPPARRVAPPRVVPPRVLATWLQRPAPAAAETGAVIALAGRVHALALRLEHLRGRWRCTAVETTAF